MRRLNTLALWWPLFAASVCLGQDQTPPPAPLDVFPTGYRDNSALLADLRAIAGKHPKLVEVRELGRSIEDRPIALVRIGDTQAESGARKPAILIVANLEADHLVGAEVATRLVERLAASNESDPEITGILDHWTVYVVPRLNPDGAVRMLSGSTRTDFRGNVQTLDRDRDGRSAEDGPDDLDRDGMSLTMRVKDALATLIPDEKDPRILKKAEIAKSESPVYSLYREGIDNDGDGLVDEDPPSGVLLNHNWPHKWPEFDREAGYSPAAEPETRALIRFIVDHPEIVALIQYGLYDTVANEPKKPATTLNDGDLPFFVELSRNYATRTKDAAKAPAQPLAPIAPATDQPRPPAPITPIAGTPTHPGSASTAIPPLETGAEGALCEWAYQQMGMLAIGAQLWTSPEIPEPAEGQPKPPAEGDARWFHWNDNVVGAQAFVPFKPFDHPTLGPVEIGGWKPGVRLNPPPQRLGPIADGQLLFLKDIASRLPRLEIVDAKADAKGAGIYEIRVRVKNPGTLPTALAQGIKSREGLPVVIRFRAPGARILTGRTVVKVDNIAGLGGGHQEAWLVEVPSDVKSVEIEATTPRAGTARQTIKLE